MGLTGMDRSFATAKDFLTPNTGFNTPAAGIDSLRLNPTARGTGLASKFTCNVKSNHFSQPVED
jgi:hypothetical protein